MKILIISLLLIVSNFAIAQNYNINQLTKKIDSITILINTNEKIIDTLLSENLSLKKELDKYYFFQNKLLLEKEEGELYVCIMGTLLYETIDGKSLSRINKGDKVKIIENLEEDYKVYFNGQYGYVSKIGFKSEEKILANKKLKEIDNQNKIKKEQKLEQLRIEEQEKRKQAEKERLKKLINKYGKIKGQKVFDGYIWLGMTKKMVKESWGIPNDINKTVGSWGVHEQWVYSNNKYIYIENGVLTSWQD